MTRVLLVQPEVNFERTYPLGLAYLAGYLRRHGVEVAGLDLRLARAGSLQDCLGSFGPDLVGVSAYSSAPDAAARVAREVRERLPSARTVLGGPHATLGCDPPGGAHLWDHTVRGDGEAPLLALARGETLPGEPGEIYLHPDLAELDFPDREVFSLDAYYGDSLKRGRWTAMVASRGCGRRCAYCAAHALSGGRHRPRDPAAIIEELRRLRRDHQVDGVLLEDDNLFADRAWARDLLEALACAHTGGVSRLHLPNGVDPMLLDRDLLAAAARAGVASISLGIETLDPEQQAALGRPIDPAHLAALVRTCRELGIRAAGFFIIGLPGDTIPSVLGRYRRIRGLGLDLAHVSVYQPLPGLSLPEPDLPLRTLAALRGLFYPYFYADYARARRAMGDGELTPGALGKAAARFVHWMFR